MTDEAQQSPEPGVKSDEAWKDQVKAEDARFDAERSQSGETQSSTTEASPSEESPPPIDPSELPKPQFTTLVGLFSTQAMVSLGMIGHPEDGKLDIQLPLARHFIDLLGVLEEKTRGNLSDGEANLLEQTLHDLRMAYVEQSRTQK